MGKILTGAGKRVSRADGGPPRSRGAAAPFLTVSSVTLRAAPPAEDGGATGSRKGTEPVINGYSG